jgi:geranylgeranyl diphosphate synthase type II
MTVHEKWDVNTGILSGDAMLILAYQYFEQYEPAVLCDWQNYLVKQRLKSVKDSNGC